jgi:hypothetical protein
MLRRIDEPAKLAVRHRRAVDPESADLNPVRWRFLGIVAVRAHAKVAARRKDHVGEQIRLRLFEAFGNLAL